VDLLTNRFPLRRSKEWCGFPGPVTGTSVASHEVGCAAKSYKCRACSLLGCLLPALASLFPTDPRGLTQHRPPFSLKSGFILSCALPPLQSSRPLQTRPLSLRTATTFREVSLPIATFVQGIHLPTSFPCSPTIRPQCFSHSRRVTPPCTS
jgi:hypothetical protein